MTLWSNSILAFYDCWRCSRLVLREYSDWTGSWSIDSYYLKQLELSTVQGKRADQSATMVKPSKIKKQNCTNDWNL